MTATPITALLMRSNTAACRTTAAVLRSLGYAVTEFDDEVHLYAHTIHAAIAPGVDRRSLVILTEPTDDVVRDLEMLRSGNWQTPLVLVGQMANPEMARRLDAACLPSDQPTAEELRGAIKVARSVSERQGVRGARHAPEA